MTLHARISDCDKEIYQDFLYVYFKDVIIDGTSSGSRGKIEAMIPPRGTVRLSVRIPKNILAGDQPKCGELYGGSMVGGKAENLMFAIKR